MPRRFLRAHALPETWHDTNTKVKGKKADINRSLRKTGGCPPSEISMTMTDNDIAKLIGPITIYGDASVDESIAEFNFENIENNEIENATDFKGNNTAISKTVSRYNNVLKDTICKKNLDLITKISVEEESSINCEKENYPSVSEKSVDCDVVFILESSNKEMDINSKMTLDNQNQKPIRRTAVTTSIKKCRQNTSQQRAIKQGCFDNTLSYTKSLTTNVENDLKIRSQYYNKKLQLLERDVIAKERIATAIETYYAITNQENLINYEEVENLEETDY